MALKPSGSGQVWPSGAPPIFAEAAIMIDANSGRTIYEKNADQRRAVASTQKLLTAMMVAEKPLDARLRVETIDTLVPPSRLGLRPGETYTRRELLSAMMVRSSNDAANTLARNHSGSLETFLREMNQRARYFGAHDSYFANVHGLPARQYSTARDIARIAYHAYRTPELRPFMTLQGYAFRHANGRVTRLEATNKLLERSSAYDGMKTGYTSAAGRCLVSSMNYRGRRVILVQLGSRTRDIFGDAERLMAWGARQTGGLFADTVSQEISQTQL
ncbi:MAG: D-alanyl-D-alanine carboxypeptidase family protein [Verrucomicrobiales bacterium]